MTNSGIEWKETDYWKIYLKTTVWATLGIFGGLTSIGVIGFVLTSDWLPVFIFLGVGTMGAILVMTLELYSSRKAPVKVGFDRERILYVDRGGNTRSIDFHEVEKVETSSDEKGNIGIWKRDGTEIVLYPGLGGIFGKSLLKNYRDWVRVSTGKYVDITVEEIAWGKLKKFVVLAPIDS